MGMPQVGDPAPDFSGILEDGRRICPGDYKGRHVVLYFYPKDNTPGCTKQACGLRDVDAELRAAGADVIGVSADSQAKHQKFIDNYQLPFSLLADTERAVIVAYGCWVEKSLYGRKYMGIQRATFVIDPEGRIKAVFPKVKPAEHAKAVLGVLAE